MGVGFNAIFCSSGSYLNYYMILQSCALHFGGHWPHVAFGPLECSQPDPRHASQVRHRPGLQDLVQTENVKCSTSTFHNDDVLS